MMCQLENSTWRIDAEYLEYVPNNLTIKIYIDGVKTRCCSWDRNHILGDFEFYSKADYRSLWNVCAITKYSRKIKIVVCKKGKRDRILLEKEIDLDKMKKDENVKFKFIEELVRYKIVQVEDGVMPYNFITAFDLGNDEVGLFGTEKTLEEMDYEDGETFTRIHKRWDLDICKSYERRS